MGRLSYGGINIKATYAGGYWDTLVDPYVHDRIMERFIKMSKSFYYTEPGLFQNRYSCKCEMGTVNISPVHYHWCAEMLRTGKYLQLFLRSQTAKKLLPTIRWECSDPELQSWVLIPLILFIKTLKNQTVKTNLVVVAIAVALLMQPCTKAMEMGLVKIEERQVEPVYMG